MSETKKARKTGKHFLKEGSLATLTTGKAHHDGGGLYLDVGAKKATGSWMFRYPSPTHTDDDGKPLRRSIGLGSLTNITLHQARVLADEMRVKVYEKKIDPLEEKMAAKAAPPRARLSFREAAEKVIAAKRPTWKTPSNPKHGKRRAGETEGMWRYKLDAYVYPMMENGNVDVALVDEAMVDRVLDPLWNDGKTPTLIVTAGIIRHVLRWAVAKKYRPEGPNPANWSERLAILYPDARRVKVVKNFEALPVKDMPVFMARLRQLRSNAADALAFLIYTAVRSHNVLDMRWREIDWENATWTIADLDLKGRKGEFTRPFVVPLSKPAMAILEARRLAVVNPDALVFPGRRPGRPYAAPALRRVLQLLGYVDVDKDDHITVHGFRSTFTDWADEQGRYSARVVNAALLHKVEVDGLPGDVSAKVKKAYLRGAAFERRIPLMEDWAAFCSTPPVPKLSLVSAAA